MGIKAIIDNRVALIQGLNAELGLKNHPFDNLTAFRCLQPPTAATSDKQPEGNNLEVSKGSRLFEVSIEGMPSDAGGNGSYNTLWSANVLVRIRYDLKGMARTTSLASIDAAWISRVLIDPSKYGSVTEFEAVSPPTVVTAVDLEAGSLILSLSFPSLYYEDSLGSIGPG
jgi:hypothetical protein